MAIKFKCPKCGKELTVKDELAGRQGKCPFCKTVVTVPAANRPKPASAVAPSPARKPAARRAPVEEEEVIDAEVVEEEEEVIEAEVIDEPAPKRKSSRETSPDDFDVPSKKSSAPARRGSRRDEEDDEEDEDDRPRRKSRRRDDDDEDEEEDERPRKKSRRRDDRPSRKKASARRQRDDDDDDEEEDDDPKDRKARARARRALNRKAGTGANLCFIGLACYTGAWALLTVISLILSVMALVGAGRAGFDLLRVVGYLMDGLLVINWVLFVVGSCFLIFDPGKNGEKGLAITTLILCVLALGGFLYLRFASNVEMILLLLLTAF